MTIALVDLILQRWQRELGGDFRAYRNHVHRVIHFCDAYRHGNAEEREKVIIAACFHDLGIWTNRTFDYLQPSVVLMRSYLRETGLEAWSPHIELMIAMHHRIRPHDDAVVEAFRRSDLVDLSLGLVRFALPSSCVREVKKDYPNAGFHRALVRVATSWLARHPLNPLPVVRW